MYIIICTNKRCYVMLCYVIWHVCFYSRHKQKLLILLRLNDFMTCSMHFNIQSEGVLISALEHCRKIEFSIYVHQTLMIQSVNTFTLE